ncbi:MAG: EAL domain-containing protein [Actinomycetota bacterium]|nr:EAL domain-containing protein [Actinomycetota bacterium]
MATALSAALALYVYKRRGGRGAILLVLLLLAMSEWSLAYALELVAADPAVKVFWARAKLAGALALPPLWLALNLHCTGRAGWLDRRTLALLVILPILMLTLAWTNPANGVAWRYARPDAEFWLIVACSYGLLLLGAAVLVSTFFGSQPLYRKQSSILLLAALAPWAANALNLMELTSAARLDLTPFAFPLTAGFLAWAISRYRLLDIVPVDRERVIQGMKDGVIVLDPQNRVVDLNPAAERILDRVSSKALGRNISQLVSSRTGWLIEAYSETTLLERYREEGKAYTEVSVGEGPAQRSYGLVLSSLGEVTDRRANRLLLLRDITERKLDEDRLDRLAHYDLLTGLPNRRLFYDRLNQVMARARRRKAKAALLFVDLDRFKRINDTLGHEVGDLLLKEVADRLAGCLRDVDTVCRLAGDEFVVLLTDITEAEDAAVAAQRIIEALSAPYRLKDHELSVTVSMGISVYPSDGQEGAFLLEKADVAMYRAKTSGKHGFEFYKEGMSVGARVRLGLEGELRRALEKGEFRVHYQPIVSMESGKVFGIEALVRWEHPERGLLSPAEFIPVADQTGLIVPIGLSVLEESCAQTIKWQEWRGPDLPLAVFVNLSATQLKHPDLDREVARILQKTGLEASSLVLEIGESAIVEDVRSTSTILQRLKSLRVRLVVDDFGTGYSRLLDLNRLPVDFLKIDHSLVNGLEEDREKMAMAAATVALAHALGLGAIAEGVETSQQLAHLRGLGCDLAQGHYMGEALPPDGAARAISFIDRYFL